MAHSVHAERLREVQERMGIETLQDFVQRLNDGAATAIPYATARRYHNDREPSVSYLARVAEVFPEIRPEYLLSGALPVTHAEERGQQAAPAALRRLGGMVEAARDPVADAFRGSAAGWLMQSQAVEARVLALFPRFHAQQERMAHLLGQELPTTDQTVQEFAELLARPIMRWHTNRLGLDVHADRLAAYMDAALLALALALPDGRDFDFLHLVQETDNG